MKRVQILVTLDVTALPADLTPQNMIPDSPEDRAMLWAAREVVKELLEQHGLPVEDNHAFNVAAVNIVWPTGFAHS